MSEKLEFTGERFTPECEREIRYEHFHRYALAARWCAAGRVLDAACGEGYGSALLARAGAQVTGVDLSPETVEHARRRYAGSGNVEFVVADCTDLPFDDAQFDRVVSFETLEHLAEQAALLAEFRRVLKPDGFLLLSSPDKAVYTDQQGFENEFHVRELYREELESLVADVFPAARLYGQKLMFHSVIWSLDAPQRVRVQSLVRDALREDLIPHAPMYFIMACAADGKFLPGGPGELWLFDDAGESVYRHYHHEIRKNMAAGGILAERDRELEELRRQLAAEPQPWWRRWIRGG